MISGRPAWLSTWVRAAFIVATPPETMKAMNCALSASTRSLIGLGADVEVADESWVDRLAEAARSGRRVVRIVVPSSSAGRPGGDVDRLLDAGVPVEVCGPRCTLVVSEERLEAGDAVTREATTRYPGVVRVRTRSGTWRVLEGTTSATGRTPPARVPSDRGRSDGVSRVIELPEPATA